MLLFFRHGANQLPAIMIDVKSRLKVISSSRAKNFVKRYRDLVSFSDKMIIFEVYLLNIYLINRCLRDSELPKRLTLLFKC